MGAMRRLHTIGYEGASLAAFVDTLQLSGVTLLVDVRDYPLSRKKGFSKRALASALQDAGIGYEHWRSLGAPRRLRYALKESNDWDAFEQAFDRILDDRNAELEALAGRVQDEVACLMCFEHDHRVCHRSLVASRMAQQRLIEDVDHLAVT